MIPLGFPFILPTLGSGPVQNTACTHHQSGKGIQIGVCSTPIREGVCLGICKLSLLHIHPGGPGLRVLIDSCMLHSNRLYCACLSHNSICYNQMYVCIECL